MLYGTGLDESCLPNEIRPIDAFKRATRELEGKRLYDSESDMHQTFSIRDIVTSGMTLQRNIIIKNMQKDQAGRQYDTEEGRLYFHRDTNTISFEGSARVEAIVEDIQELYKTYLENYNAHSVRSSVTKMMEKISPIPVRLSGGVYFVPKNKTRQLERLIQFVSSLKNAEAIVIPLVNSEEYRELIETKLVQYVEKLIKQAQDANTEANCPHWKYKTAISDARRMLRQFNDYREILGKITKLENLVESLGKALETLFLKKVNRTDCAKFKIYQTKQ